jgi:hypothetical protein
MGWSRVRQPSPGLPPVVEPWVRSAPNLVGNSKADGKYEAVSGDRTEPAPPHEPGNEVDLIQLFDHDTSL